MRYNPIETLTGPTIGEKLTELFKLKPIRLDGRLAAKRPDLWGELAYFQIECFQDFPTGTTVADLVNALRNRKFASELGLLVTLKSETGGVVTERDSLWSLLDEHGISLPIDPT